MNHPRLLQRNRRYYARFYRLAALAVVVAVAVITGSLLVGDSVRTTLVRRVEDRLGAARTIILSGQSFMDEEILETPLLAEAEAWLVVNGFIASGERLIPVTVWGAEDTAWVRGSALVNPALARELGGLPPTLVLRLPAAGMVPSGSLFVTENYTTSLRLSLQGIMEAGRGGNISLKNEQALPLNLFLSRRELAEVMELPGKVNLIRSDRLITPEQLEAEWRPVFSGLSVHRLHGFSEVRSDRVFLPGEVVSAVCRENPSANRLFSYLANGLIAGDSLIPYSFVTALDRYDGEPLENDAAILSDYAARRLQVAVGDRVRFTYFTSHDLKVLTTDTVTLRVKRIVPLAQWVRDSTLSASFPGLTDVERCTDWESDMPIDMGLIGPEDEHYWELYRQTPKAIIPYAAVADDWSNAYGRATAVRVASDPPDLSALAPEMFGIRVIHPRAAGLYGATHGVDFAGLFLALGCFIVVGGLILMRIPLAEMMQEREMENGLMQSIGFSDRTLLRLRWREAFPVVFYASLAGVAAGILYTLLVMWLLGNIWKGATHTDGFSFYPGAESLLGGWITGVALALWSLRAILRGRRKREIAPGSHPTSRPARRLTGLTIFLGTLAFVLLLLNLLLWHSVPLFMITGAAWIGVFACGGYLWVVVKGTPDIPRFGLDKWRWSALYASRASSLSAYLSLALGVFIVFSVGLNRQDFSDGSRLPGATGGYDLWGETAVPVYHQLATPEGRQRLALPALPDSTDFLTCLRYSADEASCTNLNKVTTPSVLGLSLDAVIAAGFGMGENIYGLEPEALSARLKQPVDPACPVYPVLVDAGVLTWSLMKAPGDTLFYEGKNGRQIALLLAGTLSGSLFQGYVLMDQSLFREVWPEITGSDLFLVRTSDPVQVKNTLSRALYEYGIQLTPAPERLRHYHSVTDTYLTIFMTLGGIGLLLGLISFVVVVRKNLTRRRSEILLYRRLGFTDRRIAHILVRENLPVPLYALATGTISALVGVTASLPNVSLATWGLTLFFLLLFVGCIAIFVRRMVWRTVQICRLVC